MNFKQNPGEGLINTDRFPKQVPKVQASSGVLGRASPGNGLDHIPGYAIRDYKGVYEQNYWHKNKHAN